MRRVVDEVEKAGKCPDPLAIHLFSIFAIIHTSRGHFVVFDTLVGQRTTLTSPYSAPHVAQTLPFHQADRLMVLQSPRSVQPQLRMRQQQASERE